MALGWLLIPALGGYWFLTHCNWTRFNATRASGYHFFFQAAIAGAVLVVVAYVFASLGFRVCPYGGALWKSFVPFSYSGTAVLSAVLGVASPLVLNRFHGKGTATRQAARDKGDLIELLLAESTERQLFVELSLRTGKSYTGLALNSGLQAHGESDIALIPLASGYREPDSQELKITTYYAKVIKEWLDELEEPAEGNEEREVSEERLDDLNDFRIVVPMSEIVSARLFDLDVYERFQEEP